MILRFEEINDPTRWYEYKIYNKVVVVRSDSALMWVPSNTFLHSSSLADVETYYQTYNIDYKRYEVTRAVGPHGLGLTSVKTLLELQNMYDTRPVNNKCDCDWREVYMNGCKKHV